MSEETFDLDKLKAAAAAYNAQCDSGSIPDIAPVCDMIQTSLAYKTLVRASDNSISRYNQYQDEGCDSPQKGQYLWTHMQRSTHDAQNAFEKLKELVSESGLTPDVQTQVIVDLNKRGYKEAKTLSAGRSLES